MVVSLQREKVTGSLAVAPPYLQRRTAAGNKIWANLRRTSTAGEPPEVAENLRW